MLDGCPGIARGKITFLMPHSVTGAMPLLTALELYGARQAQRCTGHLQSNGAPLVRGAPQSLRSPHPSSSFGPPG